VHGLDRLGLVAVEAFDPAAPEAVDDPAVEPVRKRDGVGRPLRDDLVVDHGRGE
jgi:hypothetical protein